MQPIELQVEASLDLPQEIREEWDRVILEAGGDIHLSYDWCRSWWEVYGGGRLPRIFLFRQGDRLVGVLPMLIDDIGFGPFRLRIARFLYTDMSRGVVMPPVAGDYAEVVYQKALEYLLNDQECDAVSFSLLSGFYTGDGALREACEALGRRIRVENKKAVTPQSIFELPADFEEYLMTLGKKRRRNWRRGFKLLEKDGVHLEMQEVRDDEEALRYFDEFKEVYSSYWKSKGQPGNFGDMPELERFMMELIRSQGKRGGLRLYLLRVDGRAAAYQWCFRFGDYCHWRICARLYGEPWDRYNLGTIGMMQVIESALKEGVRYIETGPGHYDYKVEHGAHEIPVQSFRVISRSVGARVRWMLFRLVKWGLDVLYDKIWFYRIAPRFRLPRGPFWKIWLRMQV